MLSETVKASLGSRRWYCKQYNGCWTVVDLAIELPNPSASESEKEAFKLINTMLASGEIEEIRVEPGYARMFRFVKATEPS